MNRLPIPRELEVTSEPLFDSIVAKILLVPPRGTRVFILPKRFLKRFFASDAARAAACYILFTDPLAARNGLMQTYVGKAGPGTGFEGRYKGKHSSKVWWDMVLVIVDSDLRSNDEAFYVEGQLMEQISATGAFRIVNLGPPRSNLGLRPADMRRLDDICGNALHIIQQRVWPTAWERDDESSETAMQPPTTLNGPGREVSQVLTFSFKNGRVSARMDLDPTVRRCIVHEGALLGEVNGTLYREDKERRALELERGAIKKVPGGFVLTRPLDFDYYGKALAFVLGRRNRSKGAHRTWVAADSRTLGQVISAAGAPGRPAMNPFWNEVRAASGGLVEPC